MLLVHCWARLCGGDLEVKAFHCQAMAGMWLVRWQECGMAETHIFLAFRNICGSLGTDAQTIWAPHTMIKHTLLLKILSFIHSKVGFCISRTSSSALCYSGRLLDTRPWDWVEASWKMNMVLASINDTCTASVQQYFTLPLFVITHCKDLWHCWDYLWGINKFSSLISVTQIHWCLKCEN